MSLFIFFLFFLSLFFFSATQVCHYSKEGDKTEITAAKFGCVSHGEDEKDGEKKNQEVYGILQTRYCALQKH